MTLELRNVTKILGGRTVVDDVSFRVENGEFFVLLGTSGSGKSTILRMVAGLEKPDKGEILLEGKNITAVPPRDRNLGMVFQDYGLYPNMNTYQNIAYGLEAKGLKRAEVEQRVNEAAAKLQIESFLKRSISDLSGGEQQRVALARALAKDAFAYLFDEPLSNLDPKLRFSARHDIQSVHRMKRKPSLYVTHDQTEAFALGDRIGILSNGKMQQIGTAEVLMSNPVNTFVASFLGSTPINLVVGEINREGSSYQLCVDNSALRLPPRWTPYLSKYGKRRVVAGIRPDSFTYSEIVNSDSSIHGEVEAVEEMLGETILMLRLPSEGQLTAVLSDVEMDHLESGTPLTLQVDTDAILLFDIETNRALDQG